MKRAVVTGATGFIGSWLVKELLQNDIEVIALVRNLSSAICMFGENKNLQFVEYDSKAYEQLCMNSDREIDCFYHLAWGGVATEMKNECNLQMENISFSLKMLEAASEMHVRRFVATGTVAEYAFCENIMDVNARQTPNDMYGAAKTATHYMLETRARMLKMPFIWAVVPSTFGEGRRDNNIITYTIKSLLQEKKPSYGYLTQMWDFLYVEEVARALRYIGDKGHPEKTYGIGSGVFRPLRDYIMTIRDIINPEIPLGIGDVPSYSDKAFSSCVSIYDLTKDTGYVPRITFEEGIRRTIEYYREQLDEEANG